MKITKTKTSRGFSLIEFDDLYGEKCQIQKSSLATQDAIWFGIKHASPKIMARDAKAHGVETNETTGWVDYPVPECVLLSTRMHLSIKQVKKLIPILQRFVDEGDAS